MFTPHKRIFAGKGNLRTEPLCPYLTDDIGYVRDGDANVTVIKKSW